MKRGGLWGACIVRCGEEGKSPTSRKEREKWGTQGLFVSAYLCPQSAALSSLLVMTAAILSFMYRSEIS